eukprot:8891371-Alexandrium_andersonii.AAC.1
MRTPKSPAERADPNRGDPRRSHQKERDPSTPLRDCASANARRLVRNDRDARGRAQARHALALRGHDLDVADA